MGKLFPVPRTDAEVFRENFLHLVHREADDVAHRAFDVIYDQFPMVLRRIGSRFIHRVDFCMIGFQLGFAQRFEVNIGHGGEADLFPGLMMSDVHGGKDLVDPAVKRSQHRGSFCAVEGLAQISILEEDEGIGRDDGGIGVFLGDRGRLERGIFRGHFANGKRAVLDFLHSRLYDVKRKTCLAKKIAPPRGTGRKYERRRVCHHRNSEAKKGLFLFSSPTEVIGP